MSKLFGMTYNDRLISIEDVIKYGFRNQTASTYSDIDAEEAFNAAYTQMKQYAYDHENFYISECIYGANGSYDVCILYTTEDTILVVTAVTITLEPVNIEEED